MRLPRIALGRTKNLVTTPGRWQVEIDGVMMAVLGRWAGQLSLKMR